MNILFDLNVILDYLIPVRQGHHQARKLYEYIKKQKFTMWLSASSADNIQYILLATAKRFDIDIVQIRLEFERYIDEIKIFTVTGLSVRDSLKIKDLEDHIIYTNYKRIAPEGIVISKDKRFQQYPNVISPEQFIKEYVNTSSSQTNNYGDRIIPMLDLQAEYRYALEYIDHAILNTVAETKYILGPEVKELEQKIAEYIGVKHCVGASSGTEALVLSLRALAIKLKGEEYFNRSDEIITTPFTFTATGDAILRSGATPVFVDIDAKTYNIDPQKIREYLISNDSSSVVGIIPVHLYGQSCEMDEIMEIAKEHNLFVVEDVAQAFGGMWNGKKLGSIGNAGTFSFFPSKNLGGFGDGGMISTNDDQTSDLIRMLLKHGGKDKYNVDHIGYNARLDTLQAAILLAKFKYIDEFNERRQKIAEIYNQELSDIEGITIPVNNVQDGHVYHQYTINVNNGKRDELQKHLNEEGISTMLYYPVPLHKMKVFGNRCRVNGDLSQSDQAVLDVMSLPVEPLQEEKDTMLITAKIKDFFTK